MNIKESSSVTQEHVHEQNRVHPEHIVVHKSAPLEGEITLFGAKNATLVIMASLLLTKGKSSLANVPYSEDVIHMIALLRHLGAHIDDDRKANRLEIDTTRVHECSVPLDMMKRMRASILVMSPLLIRFGKAEIGVPGGCVLGARPIDYHLKNMRKMGVSFRDTGQVLYAFVQKLCPRNVLLDYPSVGATENLVMLAVCTPGITRIINAALEPEVLDFLSVLQNMGAQIEIEAQAIIKISGVYELRPISHTIMPDRLEAGALLLGAAITGGSLFVVDSPAHSMGLFLMKLQDMGHTILIGRNGKGVKIRSLKNPLPITIKTCPYPGFPTDLQAPITAVLAIVDGTSLVEETVFENRLVHVRELVKMGAQIEVDGNRALITGVENLYGTHVIASDIRASCALVLAGLVAEGTTTIAGVHHWRRGYQELEKKFARLGARMSIE